MPIQQAHQVKNLENEYLQKILGKVLDYIAQRPRTSKEIYKKLDSSISRYVDDNAERFEVRTAVESYLVEANLLNDLAYANEVVSSIVNSSKPRSNREISNFLLRKGISSDIANTALSMLSQDIELENAKALLSKKAYLLQDKQKTMRLLYRKGYSPMVINRVLEDVEVVE